MQSDEIKERVTASKQRFTVTGARMLISLLAVWMCSDQSRSSLYTEYTSWPETPGGTLALRDIFI